MGSVYYHGTNEEAAKKILSDGFAIGTYFTWDLHSALVMGNMWVFGIYFEDKDPEKNYWEWITPEVIPPERILYLRKFSVDCIYDNDKAQEQMSETWHREEFGQDIIHCATCHGHGQLNPAPKYGGWGQTEPIVCPNCQGHGYTK